MAGMRRLARWTFNALVGLSLLLFVATVVMWVRSYFVHDVHVLSKGLDGVEEIRWSADGKFGKSFSAIWPRSGQRFIVPSLDEYYYMRWVALFGVLPFGWLLSWAIRRELNRNPYACPVCGYDLRATPDRCPECGTILEKAKQIST